MNAQIKTETALLSVIRQAVFTQPAQVLFLSGGIDSSLLAALDPKVPSITVGIETSGSDLKFAEETARYLALDWHPIKLTYQNAWEALHELVLLTKSFDIGLLNDIPLFIAMKYAKTKGWLTARTGDAADTLFCGYSYLQSEGFDIQAYLHNLIPHIKVQSGVLGELMGMKIYHPYLHPGVVEIAENMQLSDNVVKLSSAQSGNFFMRNSDSSSNGIFTWGKASLRNAASALLPEYIAWRTKTDLEFGSGTYILEEKLSRGVNESKLRCLEKSGMHFWNLAHIQLYLWYERARLFPKLPIKGEYKCQWCGAGNIRGRGHCFTCGAYPAQVKPDRFLVGQNF